MGGSGKSENPGKELLHNDIQIAIILGSIHPASLPRDLCIIGIRQWYRGVDIKFNYVLLSQQVLFIGGMRMNSWRGSALASLICLTVLSFFISPALRCQVNKNFTDQLSQDADVIVVGKVGKLAAEWNADKSRIQTRVTITVSDVLKGNGATQTISVVVPGGEVGGVGEWYSHSPRFVNSEDVVVFAKKDRRGVLRVASGQQGKFTITKDEVTGSKVIPNVGTLAQFTSNIKTTLKSQQVGGKQ